LNFPNHNNPFFFRAMARRLANILLRGAQGAVRRPELPITLFALLFYIYQLWHLPALWIASLILPALGVTFGLVYGARRLIGRRLASENLRPLPELGLSFALCLAIYLTDFVKENVFALLLPLLFFLWLLWASRTRRIGVFYTGFIGLLLLALSIFSYRLLYIEERLLEDLTFYLRRRELVATLEHRYQWVAGSSGERATQTLRMADRPVIGLTLAPGMVFHDARLISFIYGVPEPGTALCYLSISQQDPFAVPAVAIFAAPQDVALNDEGARTAYLREAVERALAHRRRAGEIERLEFRGPLPLPGYLRLPSLGNAAGIQYSYFDRLLEEDVRLALFVAPDSRFVVVVNDAPTEGLLFEPAVLATLRGIKIYQDMIENK
jgi:hypothetical protein